MEPVHTALTIPVQHSGWCFRAARYSSCSCNERVKGIKTSVCLKQQCVLHAGCIVAKFDHKLLFAGETWS